MTTTTKLPSRQLRIGSTWRDAEGGATFASSNPVDETHIADIADAQPADVDAAVGAARTAFETSDWATRSGASRGLILNRVADALEAEAENLAAIETLEVGKLYSDGLFGDIPATVATFRYYAGWADKLSGATHVLPDYGGRHRLNYTLREPLGVIGAITPWNNPLVIAGWKVAPALAAGNAVVIKPPEDASLSTLRLAELLTEAGVPDGIVNVVPGIGSVAGAALAQHPGIDKITFTGSPEVGRQITPHAGGNFRKITLELGGKNPQLIFADADLEKALPWVAMANFLHQGQVCAAGTRVYAHRSIVDEVVSGLVDHARAITMGDPFDPEVGMGSMINRKQMDRVMNYIEIGKSEGAKLASGGNRLDRDGFFIEPTVFIGDNSHRIAREEIFGPVATVIPFDDMDEAIVLANDTHYGLNALVYTESLHIAQTVVRRLRVGNVWINGFGIPDPVTPWGGRAGSGLGRELGQAGIEAYTEEKTVQMMF